MRRVRLTRGAGDDIKGILRRSEAEFGAAVRIRYKRLLDQAIADLAEDPARHGVKPMDEVRPGYFGYHLRWPKMRVVGSQVGRPRHLLVFSLDDAGGVIIAAVLHERELPARHLET